MCEIKERLYQKKKKNCDESSSASSASERRTRSEPDYEAWQAVNEASSANFFFSPSISNEDTREKW